MKCGAAKVVVAQDRIGGDNGGRGGARAEPGES